MKKKVKQWVYYSHQVSTWQGESGNRELFNFKAKDSFMVVKPKVDNCTCLVFQARQKEMGSDGQTPTCLHLQTLSRARDTGFQFKQNQTWNQVSFVIFLTELSEQLQTIYGTISCNINLFDSKLFVVVFLIVRTLIPNPAVSGTEKVRLMFTVLSPVFITSQPLHLCLYYSIVWSSVLMKLSLTPSAFLWNGHMYSSAITK